MKIILDTNFLVYCAKQKIDYLTDIQSIASGKLVVLSSVLKELKSLKEKARKNEDKQASSIALQILKKNIENKKIQILNTEKNADKAIQKIAEKQDIVATLDKELKNRLKGKARILSIRQEKKLEIL